MAISVKKPYRPPLKIERAPNPAPTPAPAAPEIVASAAIETSEPEVETTAAAEAFAAPAAQALSAEAVEAPLATAGAIQENMRGLVEKGLVESRAKYAEAKTVAQEGAAAVEASFGAARDGVIAFNVMAIEAIKAESAANFDMLKSLAGARSISDLVVLQAESARKRFDDASARAKQLTELARKVAGDTVAPIKAHVAKTFKVAV